jgi:hypothetical protein
LAGVGESESSSQSFESSLRQPRASRKFNENPSSSHPNLLLRASVNSHRSKLEFWLALNKTDLTFCDKSCTKKKSNNSNNRKSKNSKRRRNFNNKNQKKPSGGQTNKTKGYKNLPKEKFSGKPRDYGWHATM